MNPRCPHCQSVRCPLCGRGLAVCVDDPCDHLKCTCPPPGCAEPCKGACGCEKCAQEYSDFLSVE